MPDRAEPAAGDPLENRRATSHERMHGQPWDASYADGPAPWDLGRPQPAVVRLAAAGVLRGVVLDAGCGTGENALHIASLGVPVTGVDVAATALAIAREKARQRGVPAGLAEFTGADALHLESLGRTFSTALDCGLFHTFDADERPRYLASLASVIEPGAALHLLCLSDVGPDVGPHPVGRAELEATFEAADGWELTAVEPARIETRFHDDRGAPAWLARVARVGAQRIP